MKPHQMIQGFPAGWQHRLAMATVLAIAVTVLALVAAAQFMPAQAAGMKTHSGIDDCNRGGMR